MLLDSDAVRDPFWSHLLILSLHSLIFQCSLVYQENWDYFQTLQKKRLKKEATAMATSSQEKPAKIVKKSSSDEFKVSFPYFMKEIMKWEC